MFTKDRDNEHTEIYEPMAETEDVTELSQIRAVLKVLQVRNVNWLHGWRSSRNEDASN